MAGPDLLDRMVVQISRDLEMNPVSGGVTITLGDYIDRGPDSRGALSASRAILSQRISSR
jgi:hypothetical protein